MCGIAGIIAVDTMLGERDLRDARQMTAILRHRGPDDSGIVQDARCVLGNARLRIIDLTDAGHQPMPNEDETVWLTFNGIVTNYRELRKEFDLDRRHRFRSGNDTEVLVHLYEEIGIDVLRRLRGHFAFCLYDKKANKVFVVRDPYGVRPLFFLEHGGRLYFASEMKSFFDLACFRDEINREAFFHYFSLVYLPDRMTPFTQVQELDGGALIEVDLEKGTSARREYFRITYRPDDAMTERDAAPKLHALMDAAVDRAMVSDAPIGLTLSGGFDTSSILALLKKRGASQRVHTFSVVMGESSFSEAGYQKIMVDFARPIHHEIRVGPDEVAECLIAHNAFLDEPTGDGSTLPTFLMAREAKRHVSVLLSGEGGDEVFNAYETHVALKARKLYRRLTTPGLRCLVRGIVRRLPADYRKLSFDFVAKRFTEGAELSVPEAHFFWRHALNAAEKAALMPGHRGFPPTEGFFVRLFDEAGFADDLNRISLVDFKYFFIDDLMVKNDRMMMAHSIEARFPWVDQDLVDFVTTVPPRLRIKGLKRRYLQKQAMKDHLPRAIYRRSNMGLEMPHAIWFLRELRPVAERYFAPENVRRTEFLDPAAVRTMWGEHLARKKDHGRSLWAILNFLIWFDLFVWNKDFKKYLA
jgi:asparagine synthase (glutamine-hydrolysing)